MLFRTLALGNIHSHAPAEKIFHQRTLQVAQCGQYCHGSVVDVNEKGKHEVIFAAHREEMHLERPHWMLGEDYTQAPNCITCHMGASRYTRRTHDMGQRHRPGGDASAGGLL